MNLDSERFAKLEESMEQVKAALLGSLEGGSGLIGQTEHIQRKLTHVADDVVKLKGDLEGLKQWQAAHVAFGRGKAAAMTGSAGIVGAVAVKLVDLLTK